MASTSGSKRTSPPPSPPPPSRVRRVSLVPLGSDRKNYPRRPGKEQQEPDETESSALRSRRKRGRVLVQDDQELRRVDNHDLQLAAKELFDSNDPSRLLTLVRDFAESSNQNPQSQVKALWNFCARQCPNALSLNLAHLLNSPLPPGLRIHAVALLHRTLNEIHGKDMSRIHHRILNSLKPLLLNVLQKDESIPNIFNLSEIVANVASRIFQHPIGSWDELLEYVFNALHMDLEMRQEMALKVFSGLPEKSKERPHIYKFWENNYPSLHMRFCQLFNSPNLNIQALTFDASVRLVRMLNDLGTYEEIDDLLPKMILFLQAFHMDGQTDFVLPRIKVLADLAKHYAELLVRHLDAVFHCVLQIAETEGANTVLRCEAIKVFKVLDDEALDQMSEFINNLSKETNRRVFEICVRMMLCITDDPAWYDVDTERSEYAGITESYHLGRFLLDRVSFEGQEAINLIVGVEMIPTYLIAEDWQTRHAAMIAFAAIGEACGSEMIRYTDHAERLLDISLTDPHPRVCWAAIDAIRCFTAGTLQEGFSEKDVQYLNKFLPKLVTIIRGSRFPRLQAHATLVIRFLIKNCGDHEVISFSEDLVTELLKLLKQDEQKLREEAMETLKSFAISFPFLFRRYYRETMDSLKALLFQTSSKTKLLLRAKSIECMSNIVFVFGLDESRTRTHDAMEVMKTLLSIGRNWKDADLSIKVHVLKALSQLSKLPELVASNFLTKVMPMLIRSLENSNPYNSNVVTDHISTNNERILACDLLSNFAGRFKKEFSPWVPKVSHLFTRLFSSPDSDTQIASVGAIPNLLLSSQHRQQPRSLMVSFIVQALVEALHEETDRATSIAMLESLNGCITISGPVFSIDLIKLIANEINQILSQQSLASLGIEIEEEAEFPDEGDEQEQEEEIIRSANCLVTMINTLKSTFLPYIDELLPTVALLWGDAFPNRVKAIAISIFNLLVQDYPDKLEMYHDTYASVLLDACQSESPQVQQEAARGIGFCAMFKGSIFKFDANEHGNASDRAKTYDVAVSAFGKICEFCRDSIDGPQVVPIWLNFLPLKSDFVEARYVHELLCQMLERLDQDLLGPNNENLPKVIEILNEVLLGNDNLATEETTSLIIALLNQYGAMP